MSQITKNLTSGGPIPPTIPTQFTADDSTIGIPSANNLNIFSRDTTTNNVNGIQTTADPNLGDDFYVELTNRITGTVTTTDATLTTIASFPLGATPGVFTMEGNFSGFIPALNRGGSYFCDASSRTDGVSATEIGSNIDTIFEDVDMVTSDIFFTVSGNSVVLQVQGIAATTINWRVLFEYTVVT